jgi:hypothetical protein
MMKGRAPRSCKGIVVGADRTRLGVSSQSEQVRRSARDEARRLAGNDGLIAALDANRLDAIVAPSMSPAWITDHLLGDH